jgi:ATPase subunit of ABC transporter with duplicated ATPase domains
MCNWDILHKIKQNILMEITLLQTMEDACRHERMKVRDMLGSFLFRGDDVDKKVKVLSGGERSPGAM